MDVHAPSPLTPDVCLDSVSSCISQAYLRTQQLRTMIEWGRAAMGRYHQGGSEPGEEGEWLGAGARNWGATQSRQ